MIIDDSLNSAGILIVDDQAANIALLSELLTKHGYTDLRSTTDARQVVALCGARRPDLILLDLLMPHLSGFEVMEQLRPLIPPDDYLPILVLTADTTSETKRRALDSGATDFLAKPLDFEEVVLRVGNLLATRLLHRQLQEQNALLEEQVRERTAQVLDREARLRAMVNALPDLVFVQDGDGVFLDYHASDPTQLFVPPEQFLGKPAAKVFPAELAATLETARRATLKTRQTQAVEYALPLSNGTRNFVARMSANGDDQVVTLVRDVTERRRAEEAALASKAQLDAALASMTDAVFISDAEGQFTNFNEAFATFHKFRNTQECLQKLAEYPEILDVFMANGELAPPEQWAVPRALRGETGTNVEYSLRRKDTGETWVGSYSFAPIRDDEGMIVGSVVVGRDITEHKREQELILQQKKRAEALAQISQSLAETLDYDQVSSIITQRVAELIGDVCVLGLVSKDRQTLVATTLHHRDPEAADFARELLASSPYRLGEGLAGRVAQTGEPLLIAEVPQEQIRALMAPAMLPYVERLGIHSVLVVPLKSDGMVIGTLGVTRDRPGHPYTADDQTFLQNVADRAAQAVVNVRLYDDAQRRGADLEALREVDQVLLNSLDLKLTMRQILAQVAVRLHADAADILLLDPYSHTLTFAAGQGFRGKAIERSRLRLGEGHAGRAALERRPVSLPDLAETNVVFLRAQLLEGEGFVSYHAAPLIAKGEVLGVLEVFHRAPFAPDDEWLAFLQTFAGQTALAIDSATLFTDLQRSNADLHLAYDATIEGWSRAMDLRDRETEGHTQRVAEMTERLARAMGIGEAELVHVRRGALLHDMGKMGVPDHVLFKREPLTDDEWALMRRHPQLAYEMLSPISYLRPALDIPYCHHEKWDGSGYPRGLKGEQIPPAARLFAVVDVYDALRSDRPYRAAWDEEKVLEHIKAGSGTHFDPKVVEVFLPVVIGEAE